MLKGFQVHYAGFSGCSGRGSWRSQACLRIVITHAWGCFSMSWGGFEGRVPFISSLKTSDSWSMQPSYAGAPSPYCPPLEGFLRFKATKNVPLEGAQMQVTRLYVPVHTSNVVVIATHSNKGRSFNLKYSVIQYSEQNTHIPTQNTPRSRFSDEWFYKET